MKHRVKCHTEYYNSVVDGSKPFELRFNDRNYQVDDELILEDYDPVKECKTGRETYRVITYVLAGVFGIPDGHVILGIPPMIFRFEDQTDGNIALVVAYDETSGHDKVFESTCHKLHLKERHPLTQCMPFVLKSNILPF